MLQQAADIAAARLDLVPLQETDAAEMVTVLGDSRLHEFTGGSPAAPAELAVRYRELVAGPSQADEQWLNWIVRLRSSGTAVGTVQATVTWARGAFGQRGAVGQHGAVGEPGTAGQPEPAAAVAWVIGVPWQGRGYASEAASALVGWLADQGATLVTANIHPDHRASERVAERAGLTLTADWVDGERVWALRPAAT